MPTLTADAAYEQKLDRYLDLEDEAASHVGLDPETLAEMDAADAAAEGEPEVTGADAGAARAEARADLESGLDNQPDASAGSEPEQEAEAG
jgi:hypothetical protein